MTTRIGRTAHAGRTARAGRRTRVLHGVTAAALATFVAAVSHAATTGHRPDLANVTLALVLAAPICVLSTGRVPSWWRLSIAVVLSQVLFHSLLALDLGGSSAASPRGMPHHGIVAGALGAAAEPPALHLGADSPWMWASHALAALITIAALGSGERCVRLLAQGLARAFRALVPLRGPRPTTAATEAPRPVLWTDGIAELSVMRRRGPPLAA